ncbi:MAG: T9SS type A sorting domain-containing protein [Bacteroidetes bacterium]|nr:T9SS type A sorting domain-containing protein [Bacteroidota bacterium]MDA1224775.1 T9SS type A sorting domain-containing protein [Bacteroidota bacterium]
MPQKFIARPTASDTQKSTIIFTGFKPHNAKVFTVDGKLIRTINTGDQAKTDGFGISPGVYILRWTDADNSIKSKKIMVFEK